jgi:hypothetical protein
LKGNDAGAVPKGDDLRFRMESTYTVTPCIGSNQVIYSREKELMNVAVEDDRLRQRVERFTTEQRAAVRAFLRLVAAVLDLKCHHKAIAHALSAVWL